LNPFFDEKFEVTIPSRTAAKFILEVYDWDLGGSPDFLGKAKINLGELEPFQLKTLTVPLDSKSGEVKVSGDLTIHGVTRPVTLDVIAEGQTRDPWGGERSGFSATGRIKRSEFGLVWNQVLEAGGFAVGDDVKISIDVELVKKAA
jgi:hypothetical protein